VAFGDPFGKGESEYVNLYNIAGDRGRSSLDQPLNETLAITYNLPYGRGRQFGSDAPYLMQLVAGGWQTSVINQYTSDLPVNLTYAPSTAQDVDTSLLSSYYRANISGNPELPSSSQVKTSTYLSYLNPATVTAPTADNLPLGNAGRNIARAPNYDTLDLSVHKRIPLWSEKSGLEFRVDSFNTLNRVNYQAPDGIATDSTFGQITAFYPARKMQNLTLASPPAHAAPTLQGCGAESTSCAWEDFKHIADAAIDKNNVLPAQPN
jgi:hypothetical protein